MNEGSNCKNPLCAYAVSRLQMASRDLLWWRNAALALARAVKDPTAQGFRIDTVTGIEEFANSQELVTRMWKKFEDE